MNPINLELRLLIAEVVEGRILNQSWEQLATELKRPITELRALSLLYAEEWNIQMDTASRHYQTACVNQTMQRLTTVMQTDDLKLAERAAATLTRLVSANERVEQRRLKERTSPSPEPTPAPMAPPIPNSEPAPEANAKTPREQPPFPTVNELPTPKTNAPKTRRDHNGIPLLC